MRLGVIGVPTNSAGVAGGEATAPDVLREVGLIDGLAAGNDVHDYGNVSFEPAPTGRRHLRSPRRLSLKLPPPALLGLQGSRLALGVPNIELRHAYTVSEQVMFNAPDAAELRVPVLNVVF